MLQVEQLRFLDWPPVDLTVAEGEVVGISGASGSGKSRFLRALADIDPHTGEASLHQRPQSAFAPAEWRRAVALVPADSLWWHERAGEHFPGEAILHAADLGLPEVIARKPVSDLSVGERQRLGLLRALVREPQVLLLDEPTANLDSANRTSVEALLRSWLTAGSRCAIWVSHDEDQLARVAPRRFRFQDQRLLEQT